MATTTSTVPDLRIRIVSNLDKANDFWEWLTDPRRRYVACDLETSGLDWWSPTFKIRMIQFGDSHGGWAVDFSGWRRLIEAALDWCRTSRITIVGHNWIGFDTLALRRAGIKMDWSNISDTMVLASLSQMAEYSRGLKEIAVREFGPWAGAGEKILKDGMRNQGWSWADVPWSWRPYPMYGVLDTCLTGMLFERWQPHLKRWRAAHDLEISAARITGIMSDDGLPIDREYCAAQLANQQVEAGELAEKLKTYGVEPTKNATIVAALQADNAFPVGARLTSTGVPSVDAEALANVNHPIAKLIVRWRLVTRIAKNYLGELLDGSAQDGRVHPGINPLEARTGRMSISRPALQQLPDGPTVRGAVIGRGEPGRTKVISSDWSQIELRIWASVNKDTALIAALKDADASPVDFFTALCRTIYNEPNYTKGQDHRRTQIKSSTYAKLFGGGLEVAATTAGVEPYVMLPTWKMLERKFPSLAHNDLVSTTTENGRQIWYVTSPLYGRRFATADRRDIRKLANYICQGTAALALKKSLVAMDACGLTPHLMLPVHDEIVASSDDEDQGKEIMHEIGAVMNSVITEEEWGIGVPAEPGIGNNWYEAK